MVSGDRSGGPSHPLAILWNRNLRNSSCHSSSMSVNFEPGDATQSSPAALEFFTLTATTTHPTHPFRAPYYVIHKIMAGLLDAHVMVGNARAFDMVGKISCESLVTLVNHSSLGSVSEPRSSFCEPFHGAHRQLFTALHPVTT